MVDFNRDNDSQATTDTKPKTIADVVCPVHFKPLPYPNVQRSEKDTAGLEIRTYFGWCFECNRGYAVIQFKRGERWIIYKYQQYVHDAIETSPQPPGWIVLNKPPKSEDSQTDYAEIMDSLKKAHQEITGLAVTIESLIRHLAEQRGQSIDG
jgi:hypothetical protein